ncbi:patched domain-containing protein 3-like isoform X2 [Amphiura filiformis]|uniref:patched domain-containing protein 3-like isoform X2 n=1 Tax=Amphiura filiformis TaxID=82378 RepID=UPI003B226134
MGKGQEGGNTNAGATNAGICHFDEVNVHMGELTTNPGPRVQIRDPDSNSETRGKTCCNSCGPFDCIERRLRHLFAAWGRIVARHPWPMFLLPIFVSMGLAIGFFFITVETSQEKLYTPINGQAKTERKVVEELFASVSWESHTTPARLTELGRYVQVILQETMIGLFLRQIS